MKGPLSPSAVKRAAGIVVAALFILAAALVLLSRGSAWLAEIRATEWRVDLLPLLLSILLLALSYLLTPQGWVWLCRAMSCDASRRELRSAWFVSQLGRYVPGKVWLLAGRAGYLRSRGMSMKRAAFTTGMEMLLTMASVGLVVFASVWWVEAGRISSHVRTLSVVSAALFLVLPLLSPVQKLLLSRRARGGSDARAVVPTATIARAVLLYSGLWAARGASLFFWLIAFRLEGVEPAMVFLATPLAWLAGYVAFLIPGGIGVREGVLASLISVTQGRGPLLLLLFGQRVVLGLIELVTAVAFARHMRHLFGSAGRRNPQSGPTDPARRREP